MTRLLLLSATSVAIAIAIAAHVHVYQVYGLESMAQIVEPSPDIQSWTYEPRVLTVTVGDVVTWINAGAVPHSVTARDQSFDSGYLPSGEAFSWTPAAPGTYNYVCIFHPWMTGTVVVQ